AIFSAACCTAFTMLRYPVQRHRLPEIAWRISCSLGFLLRSSSALVVISIPGVQKPHCSACFSVKASCIGCSLPPCSRLSTVLTLRPSACTASTVHDFTGSPSRCTVHTPQCEVSQPTCVPVRRRFSRRKCTSSSRDSTSASRTAPFTVTLILCFAMSASRPFERRLQRPSAEHARHLALVLDRAAPVGARLGRLRRQARRFGDGLLVQRLA